MWGITNETGILLVDKPSGCTSHDVVAWARKCTGIRKIGHAGTLDPLASGLLIVLVGRQATKQQLRYLKQPKSYRCQLILGLQTDTYDIQGNITSTCADTSHLSEAQIQLVCSSFIGVYRQVVPAFAAVKIGGKKLYQLARQGKVKISQLPSRQVTISNLEVVSVRPLIEAEINKLAQQQATDFDESYQPWLLDIIVACSSGTYIRSLAHDIGEALSVGGCVRYLRRLSIGDLGIEQATICPNFQEHQVQMI